MSRVALRPLLLPVFIVAIPTEACGRRAVQTMMFYELRFVDRFVPGALRRKEKPSLLAVLIVSILDEECGRCGDETMIFHEPHLSAKSVPVASLLFGLIASIPTDTCGSCGISAMIPYDLHLSVDLHPKLFAEKNPPFLLSTPGTVEAAGKQRRNSPGFIPRSRHTGSSSAERTFLPLPKFEGAAAEQQ